MSTVEQQPAAAQNGAGAPTIAVENPATGETIAHVPDLSAEQVADLARRARIAQPGWEALGFRITLLPAISAGTQSPNEFDSG
jgi:acyl-CoA reductase-like NAD-dependent aldehyde dehydrogenase